MKETYKTGEKIIMNIGGKLAGKHGIIIGPSSKQYPGYFRRYRVKLDSGLCLVAFTDWMRSQGSSDEEKNIMPL